MMDVSESGNKTSSRDGALLYAYRFANIDYDESEGLLRVAGQAVGIEPRPLRLLSELLRRPNEVVSKDELFELLWEGRPTVDNVLANAVNKLRKALGAEGAERIVNLPRVGYRLNGPIERVAVGQQVGADLQLKAGEPVPGQDAYRLERALGRSSGGEVWLARDVKLQANRVFKFATDSERLTALKREYTLYRVLRSELGERQDFARIVSANFSTAPYFLECEYGGQDLLAWAADGNRLTGMPVDERLALFLQIARAVAAAHGVGVLHKDLKPANVLIAAQGEGWVAKLTDFGSSRLLDPGRLAELGVTAMGLTVTQRIGGDSTSGTPLYLAPELIAGQAPSTQSDLYALGLMLYQLLIGDMRRPMSTGWQRDIDDELLREDLTAATEGRLDHRLGSVTALVERLVSLPNRREERKRRALDARETSIARAELDKVRQRRPWVIGSVASLGLGLLASGWSYSRANAALRRSEQESARAQAINDFLNKDVLLAADSTSIGAEAPSSMSEVLDRASAGAAERFRDDPLTEARVRLQLGDIYARMTRLDNAEKEYRRALTLARLVAPGAGHELPIAQFSLAALLASKTRLAEAKSLLDSALRDVDPWLLLGENEVALRAAIARFKYLYFHQEFKEALVAANRWVAIADVVASTDLRSRFTARFALADALWRSGELPPAEVQLNEIIGRNYPIERVGEALNARARIQLALVQIAQAKTDGQEAALIAARDVLARKLGPNEYYVAVANTELGNLYNVRGDFERSKQALNAAYAALAAGVGEEHQSTRITALNLAVAELNTGNPSFALARMDRDRFWFVAHLGGSSSPVVQAIDFERARALCDLRRPMEALQLLQTLSPEKLTQAEGGQDWQWRLQAERGRALIGTGEREQGVALVRTAVAQMDALHTASWVIATYRPLMNSAVNRARK